MADAGKMKDRNHHRIHYNINDLGVWEKKIKKSGRERDRMREKGKEKKKEKKKKGEVNEWGNEK
jgi:hypothetical protein